jgi:hypothetical protein
VQALTIIAGIIIVIFACVLWVFRNNLSDNGDRTTYIRNELEESDRVNREAADKARRARESIDSIRDGLRKSERIERSSQEIIDRVRKRPSEKNSEN